MRRTQTYRPDVAVKALLTGTVQPVGSDGPHSAIHKTPVAGPVGLGFEGLVGDQQANRHHHGGAEKALHHYPWDHYAHWRSRLRRPPDILRNPGAFGENLSTEGLTEADVCIGDTFRLGSTVIQIAQVRQPCATLNHRFAVRDMARRVQETGRTGWYYRVREAGEIAAGDTLQLIERPNPRWPLSRLVRLLFLAPYDAVEHHQLLAVSGLAECQRHLVQQRLETGLVEDWSKRLGDPPSNS